MSKVVRIVLRGYIRSQKTLFWQSEVRDSSTGFEEVSCHVRRGPLRATWEETMGISRDERRPGDSQQQNEDLGVNPDLNCANSILNMERNFQLQEGT